MTSKTGHFFVLDRLSGKSLLPIEERPVPKSRVPGEESSPTQPFPKYDTLAPDKLSADDAWGITPEDKAWCKSRLTGLDSHGLFTPPSIEGTIMFPGNVGGVNWGSAAYDPQRGLLVAASNRLSTIVKLVPRDQVKAARKTGARQSVRIGIWEPEGAPYAMIREHLRAPSGLPCNAPPWSELIAVDLSTGMKKWPVPLGQFPSAAANRFPAGFRWADR